jgi:hypothetical protein
MTADVGPPALGGRGRKITRGQAFFRGDIWPESCVPLGMDWTKQGNERRCRHRAGEQWNVLLVRVRW